MNIQALISWLVSLTINLGAGLARPGRCQGMNIEAQTRSFPWSWFLCFLVEYFDFWKCDTKSDG